MKFETPLIPGELIKRYKRFLADIRLEDGTVVTAHCPNSGSMKGCAFPGGEVRLSHRTNPKRKLQYTWEMIHNGRCWIGINTQIPNIITLEALKAGRIHELCEYNKIRREIQYGEKCRLDFLAKNKNGALCYIEVKNVTLLDTDGCYAFPDAVTKRGKKHLLALKNIARTGHRAVMIYVIQRSDGQKFRPAKQIDPEYAACLSAVHFSGVEVLPYLAQVNPNSIELSTTKVEYILDS